MDALSRLLVKVAKRVITNNPSNETLLETADRVIVWHNANYINDEQIEELVSILPVEENEEQEVIENE